MTPSKGTGTLPSWVPVSLVSAAKKRAGRVVLLDRRKCPSRSGRQRRMGQAALCFLATWMLFARYSPDFLLGGHSSWPLVRLFRVLRISSRLMRSRLAVSKSFDGFAGVVRVRADLTDQRAVEDEASQLLFRELDDFGVTAMHHLGSFAFPPSPRV